jgi:glycerate kinase
MRILVAPDKFKGSVAAREAAQAIAAGLRDVLADAEITTLPIADGGEGTAEVICGAADGEWHECDVSDPVGRQVTARYCTIADGATAVMEMSEAAGLWRIAERERNPETASTFGVGEMLLDAARRGAEQIIIGLGGSATNDGSYGMARALGFRFLDVRGAELSASPAELVRLARIEPRRPSSLPRIIAAVDVQNPLLGADGATRVFGPQKGATRAQIDRLESALARLAEIVARDLERDVRCLPGSGAAGGLGFGLVAFCRAEIRSGFDVVAEHVGLQAAVRAADVVITGEGRVDAQTLRGKAPAGVARLARELGRPCYAISGEFEATAALPDLFVDVFAARPAGMSREEAMRNAPTLLRECARRLAESLRQDSGAP